MTPFLRVTYFIVSLLTLLLLIPSHVAIATEVHGVFRIVKGHVQVKSGATGEVSRARIGSRIYPKDTVITAQDSRAKIVMIDQNEINISPESEVILAHYEYKPNENKKDVLIDVVYGRVRSKVEQKYDGSSTNKFQVKTPSAVAGVRGTDFLTSYNPNNQSTNIVTFQGEVAFGMPGTDGSIQGSVSVRAGQFAANTMGSPPTPPSTVDNNQLMALSHESDADTSDTPMEPESSRLPATSDQESDTNTEDAPGPSQESSDTSKSGPSPENRSPAATQGNLMRPEDFAGGSKNDDFLPVAPIALPDNLPNIPIVDRVPECDFCNRIIEEGNTRLIIRVQAPGN